MSQYLKAHSNNLDIEYKLRVHKLKASFKRKVFSLFKKIDVLLLDLIVNSNEFHRAGVAPKCGSFCRYWSTDYVSLRKTKEI